MKKFMKHKQFFAVIAIFAIMVSFVVPMVFAGQASIVNQQTGIRASAQTTLWSAATGTTAAITTNYATFDYPMNNLECDFVSGQSTTTDNITVAVQANQGSSTTLFDTAGTNIGIASSTFAGSTSASTILTKGFSAKPFRTIVATVTAPTTTQVITISCSATQ